MPNPPAGNPCKAIQTISDLRAVWCLGIVAQQPDRTTREYEILQSLNDAHRAQCVCDHDAHELFGRDIR